MSDEKETEESGNVIDIVVNSVTLGTIDLDELTAEAQFRLEECARALDLLDWLVTYAGANKAEARKAIGPMKVQAIVETAVAISTTIGKALKLPKPSGRR